MAIFVLNGKIFNIMSRLFISYRKYHLEGYAEVISQKETLFPQNRL